MDHQNIRFHNVEELEPVEGRLAAPPRRCRSTRPHQPRCAGKLLCHRH